jgi:hypothetical protein
MPSYIYGVDKNHKEIKTQLEQLGFVLQIHDIASAGCGLPDLIVLAEDIDGNTRVLFLEVKYDKGKQRESQKDFEEKFGRYLEYYVVNSIDDILEILGRYHEDNK